jgi:hypothetical protein
MTVAYSSAESSHGTSDKPQSEKALRRGDGPSTSTKRARESPKVARGWIAEAARAIKIPPEGYPALLIDWDNKQAQAASASASAAQPSTKPGMKL